MQTSQETHLASKRGFTLVEIMVVVVIIGLLASIAIPSFVNSRRNAVASRIANDFKAFGEKYIMYNLSNGVWPVDGYPGTIPAGMEELSKTNWDQVTPIGGQWDWEYGVLSITAGISVYGATADAATFQAIDTLMDDGNLSTGSITEPEPGRLLYILEE